MNDHNKNRNELLQELMALRQQVAELEALMGDRQQVEAVLQEAKSDLEREVEERTIALKASNEQLVTEIAERNQIEQKLRAAKDQLQVALDAVPGIVSWIGSDLCYLGVNRHLADMYGLPPDAFIGQDIGFLHSSLEFKTFVKAFFDSPVNDALQEISALVNGVTRYYLITMQKYDQDRAAFAVGIDITDRYQATEALRKAESKYRSIFENAVEGIFQTTPEGQYLSANPSLARMYGYDSPAELMASLTSIQQQLYVDPRRRSEFVHLLHKHDAVSNFESQVYRKDGSLIWISENARTVRDSNGKVLYYEGTVEDITERKQVEETLQRINEQLESRVEERTAALRELNRRLVVEIGERQRVEVALRNSEIELRALFAAMTDIIHVFDSQGRYLKVIATNSELLYKPEVERVGKTVYEVLPLKLANLFLSHIQQALKTGKTVTLEYSLPISNANSENAPELPGDSNSEDSNLDTQERWFTANVSPLLDNSVIWVARDITQRKQSEEALRQSEIKERERSQQLAQTLKELQQTQTQLVQSEKMSSLGQLVAGVAHEINNPVNFIYGNLAYATRYTQGLLELLQLYQEVTPNPDPTLAAKMEAIDLNFIMADLPRLMASMRVGAERIREIVRSLQSFSRIDEADLKFVDIHEGIDSTLMILRHRLKAEGNCPAVELIKEYGQLPPVKCYAGQLNQVFMNILSNAIDALESKYRNQNGKVGHNPTPPTPHSPLPTPWIKIRTEALAPDRIVISISDNGPGMSKAIQQQVFDPFFTTKEVGKGTGLGMSISHQIVVERHGGRIYCFSEPEQGAEFVIELPG